MATGGLGRRPPGADTEGEESQHLLGNCHNRTTARGLLRRHHQDCRLPESRLWGGCGRWAWSPAAPLTACIVLLLGDGAVGRPSRLPRQSKSSVGTAGLASKVLRVCCQGLWVSGVCDVWWQEQFSLGRFIGNFLNEL